MTRNPKGAFRAELGMSHYALAHAGMLEVERQRRARVTGAITNGLRHA